MKLLAKSFFSENKSFLSVFLRQLKALKSAIFISQMIAVDFSKIICSHNKQVDQYWSEVCGKI